MYNKLLTEGFAHFLSVKELLFFKQILIEITEELWNWRN